MLSKKKRKPSSRELLRRLDNTAKTLWSIAIRKRDNYTCFTCGTKGAERDGKMQCGHLITAAKLPTRYDPKNMHCQCSSCNFKHEFQPEIYFNKFVQTYGEKELDKLVYKSNTFQKKTVQFLEGEIARAKNLITEMEEIKP